jgi:hypothetical protein
MSRETAISKEIQDWADLYPDRLVIDRTHAGLLRMGKRYIRCARKGWPDRSGTMSGGLSIYVEVKAPGEDLSPEQVIVHAELRRVGAVVIVADSLSDFIRQFETVQNLTKPLQAV